MNWIEKWEAAGKPEENDKIVDCMRQANLSDDEIAEALERWMEEDAPPASPPPPPPPGPKEMTLSDLLGLLAKVNAKTMTDVELKAEWDKLTPENQKHLEDEMKKTKAENKRILKFILDRVEYIRRIVDDKKGASMHTVDREKLINEKQNAIRNVINELIKNYPAQLQIKFPGGLSFKDIIINYLGVKENREELSYNNDVWVTRTIDRIKKMEEIPEIPEIQQITQLRTRITESTNLKSKPIVDVRTPILEAMKPFLKK